MHVLPSVRHHSQAASRQPHKPKLGCQDCFVGVCVYCIERNSAWTEGERREGAATKKGGKVEVALACKIQISVHHFAGDTNHLLDLVRETPPYPMDVPHRSPASYAASHTDAPHRNPASDTADLAQVEVVSPQPSLWSATLQYVNRYAWANENMTKEQAASMAESARYAKSYAVREINARKVSHNYSVGSPLRILFSWHGTFWPLVIWRYELYLYPIIHVGLIAFMGSKLEDDESLAEEDDLFWVKRYMVPWASLSLLTPLMIFFLVFFLSNCYSRFNSFFSTIQTIERSVQDLAMLMLSHVTDPSKQEMKWDAVRYLTASAMVIYSRVTKIGAGKDAQMNIEDWGRLLKRERDWQSEGGPALPQDIWERIVGWPRTRDQEANYQSMMHAAFADNPNVPDGHKIATEVPERRATCLPLLDATEVNRLRRYPGGMYSLVLCTWSMQTVVAAGLTGPALAASQSATMSMKSAACTWSASLDHV